MSYIYYFLLVLILVFYKAYADSFAEKKNCILKGWFRAGMFWVSCIMLSVGLPDELTFTWMAYCIIMSALIHGGYYNFFLNKFLQKDPFYLSERPGIYNNIISESGLHPIEARFICLAASGVWFIFLLLKNSL